MFIPYHQTRTQSFRSKHANWQVENDGRVFKKGEAYVINKNVCLEIVKFLQKKKKKAKKQACKLQPHLKPGRMQSNWLPSDQGGAQTPKIPVCSASAIDAAGGSHH